MTAGHTLYLCYKVVAGMLYKFDLVLRHQNGGGGRCNRDDGEEERCHAEVSEGRVLHSHWSRSEEALLLIGWILMK